MSNGHLVHSFSKGYILKSLYFLHNNRLQYQGTFDKPLYCVSIKFFLLTTGNPKIRVLNSISGGENKCILSLRSKNVGVVVQFPYVYHDQVNCSISRKIPETISL